MILSFGHSTRFELHTVVRAGDMRSSLTAITLVSDRGQFAGDRVRPVAAEGSTKAVVTALLANLGIAVTKFVAALLTASSSMLAEAVHSLADTSNQALLLLGGKRAKRAATPDHPFGYGRERYVYAFIVSIVLFTLGGLFALY